MLVDIKYFTVVVPPILYNLHLKQSWPAVALSWLDSLLHPLSVPMDIKYFAVVTPSVLYNLHLEQPDALVCPCLAKPHKPLHVHAYHWMDSQWYIPDSLTTLSQY